MMTSVQVVLQLKRTTCAHYIVPALFVFPKDNDPYKA